MQQVTANTAELVRFGKTGKFHLLFGPNLSKFQQDTITKISKRDGFKTFHSTILRFEDPEYGITKGGKFVPVMVLWSDINGSLHAWRIGRIRVLHKVRCGAN